MRDAVTLVTITQIAQAGWPLVHNADRRIAVEECGHAMMKRRDIRKIRSMLFRFEGKLVR
jgi:hypothetical protein